MFGSMSYVLENSDRHPSKCARLHLLVLNCSTVSDLNLLFHV